MFNNSSDFKEQMAEARRSQILMGAAQIFSEKGYHKATTKEIAKSAGVSEGTIYNYFSTKRDLLVAMVDQLGMNSLKNIFEDKPPADPRELLKAIIVDRLNLATERGAMMAPLLAEIFSDVELRELLYDQIVIPASSHVEVYVRQQIDSGRFRQIDPVIVTRALMGTLVFNVGLKLSGLDDRYKDISFDSLAEQIITLFLDGLLVDRG